METYDDIVAKAVRKIVRLRMEGKLSEVEKHVASTSMFVNLTQFQLLTQKSIPNGKVAVCGSPTNGLQEVVLLGASHLFKL